MAQTEIPVDVPAALLPALEEREDKVVVARQWQLIWWKFRKHRLAVVGGIVTICIYVIALFVEFIAPFPTDAYASRYTYAPPQTLVLIEQTPDGLRFNPYVNGFKVKIDYNAGRRNFEVDPTVKYPIGFFVHGTPYKLLGLFDSDVHLIGPLNKGDPMYLLGADHLGRDILSRTIYGTRVSVTIGLVGVAFSLFFGILLGGISGYFGGWVDNLIQRLIEFLQSIPSIPLWMALAAAIPPTVSPLTVYFLITIILSVIGWTGLARVVRGKLLRQGRPARRVQQPADHLPAYGAVIHQPHYRRGHSRNSRHDPGRNSPQLPRHRPARANCELGRAAPGSAKYPRDFHRAVAVLARYRGRYFRPVTQLPRRRPARCRRPLH